MNFNKGYMTLAARRAKTDVRRGYADSAAFHAAEAAHEARMLRPEFQNHGRKEQG